MVYEQVLTVLFAIGVGVAVIVYAAKPRHRSVSGSLAHTTGIESYGQATVAEATAMPQVTAIEAPVVEASVASVSQSAIVVTPAVVEIAPAAISEAAPISLASGIEVSAASAPVADVAGTSSQSAAGARRAPRRKSTASKTRARSPRTKKVVDTVEK
jgi:hypothetical protein